VSKKKISNSIHLFNNFTTAVSKNLTITYLDFRAIRFLCCFLLPFPVWIVNHRALYSWVIQSQSQNTDSISVLELYYQIWKEKQNKARIAVIATWGQKTLTASVGIFTVPQFFSLFFDKTARDIRWKRILLKYFIESNDANE
jgi:hypothetical protein